jgi:undecaprenyl diphosphate synthase
MDGNGRWAKKRGLPRTMGHREGTKSIQALVEAALEFQLDALTLFAFSTENWKRPKEEVDFLMGLMEQFLDKYVPQLLEKPIRMRFLGHIEGMPERIAKGLREIEAATAHQTQLTVAVSLNYGSQDEILRATKRIAQLVSEGTLAVDAITATDFEAGLDTVGMPPVDFLIRTSGEQRISNFLLYQIAYAELYFTPVYFPDFRREAFLEALRVYTARTRRFGGL